MARAALVGQPAHSQVGPASCRLQSLLRRRPAWPSILRLLHTSVYHLSYQTMLPMADPIVKADCEHFPFKVVSGGGDKPSIEGAPAACCSLGVARRACMCGGMWQRQAAHRG